MKNPVEENRKRIILECGCHAESVELEYWNLNSSDEEEWGEVSISHIIPSFYAYQDTNWNRFVHAISIIWKIITGKEYAFFSVLLSDADQIIAIRNFFNSIDTDKMLYNGKDE